MKFYEASRATNAGCHGNRFVIADLAKLVAFRRGFGPWDDKMLRAVLDIVIPRQAQMATTLSPEKVLMRWVTGHMPELVEQHGATWIEARWTEVMRWRRGSFPNVDLIASRLSITDEEVKEAGLSTLRAVGSSKRSRKLAKSARNRDRKREWRVENGATPRAQSKAATKPWEAKGMSRSAFYKKGLHKVVEMETVDRIVSHSNPTQVSDEIVHDHGTQLDAAAADNSTVRPIGGSISLRKVFIRLPHPRPTRDDDRGGRVPARAG